MERIVVLTGAGISKESGIPTFRDLGGLWSRHRIEEVASPGGFAANPELVHRFYNERRQRLQDAAIQPNAAHRALAEFGVRWPGEFLLVTQNVDDLHERAGSPDVLHMHGEMLRARCARCGEVHAWCGDLSTATACPACGAAGGMRPHVVWFGEMPLELERAYRALARCTLFVAVGTSGQVYPAAGFAAEAKRAGARIVEINPEPSGGDFDEVIAAPATEGVPAFFAALR